MQDTLVMIMAGGKGSRLGPLTVHRSKPAVPFAGRFRIIDFVLSNFINSGYRRVYVLTQYMSSSLIKHLNRNWRLSGFGEYIEVVPAQMRLGEFWYRGTADAVYQNLNLVRDARAAHVAVFGGDHVYKFAVDQMDQFHRDNQCDLTVAAFPVPKEEASAFGIIDVDARGRIIGFIEKPKDPPEMPDRPGWSLVSMGNYFFRREVIERALLDDGGKPASRHDFGRDIIPRMVAEGARVFAYDFTKNHIPGEPEGVAPYWRDVGTIDSYFTANMELRARVPLLDLYNRQWRIRSAQRDYPPARFVRAGEGHGAAEVDDSLIGEGSILASAHVRESVVSSARVRLNSPDDFDNYRQEIESDKRFEHRKTQRELAAERFAPGGHPGTLPNPGVYARHNAVDVPAMLPDGSGSELSVSGILQVRPVPKDGGIGEPR